VGGGGSGSAARPSSSPVRALLLDRRREGLLAVSRADGSVEYVDMDAADTVVDWDEAARACGAQRADGGSRFWAA
jgi:hypothetical protein